MNQKVFNLMRKMCGKGFASVLSMTAVLSVFGSNANADTLQLNLNDQNAKDLGIDMSVVREAFLQMTGRIILTNENIKVEFEKEGQHFDFTTLDGVSVRIPFSQQRPAPNKEDIGQ